MEFHIATLYVRFRDIINLETILSLNFSNNGYIYINYLNDKKIQINDTSTCVVSAIHNSVFQETIIKNKNYGN